MFSIASCGFEFKIRCASSKLICIWFDRADFDEEPVPTGPADGAPSGLCLKSAAQLHAHSGPKAGFTPHCLLAGGGGRLAEYTYTCDDHFCYDTGGRLWSALLSVDKDVCPYHRGGFSEILEA